jgi:Tol biopolymer transport system component
MDPERRRRVDDICDAALERDVSERAAFVAAACGGDEAIRQEVEALLTHAVNAERFLATPIGEVAASVLASEHDASLAGRQVGSYRIHSLLGAGGMGEVYRALDTRLGRDVAIKVVANDYRLDTERLARFEREARVLASLNHPHIAAIYGLEEADGIRGLVLELVEGDTIVERLLDGPLPIPEALTAARQIADALEAAHEKGVVHRDLKPANIKITPDGVVKVLDFGLAKVFARAGAENDLSQTPTMALQGTAEGVIAGTVAYMSPEQARGKAVDKRSDIWAFGCVLYEMLTARPAFRGDTASDTIAAILEREPDWNALPARTPANIRRLLERCLQKDQKRRLRDIGDARIEIEDALAGVSSGVAAGVTAPPAIRSRGWLTALLAGAAILLGLTTAFLMTDRFARTSAILENPLDGATFTRLTDFEGTELDAAISPDGKWVAYVSDRDGPLDVIVTQVGSGDFRNITQGKDPELPAPVRTTGFSADSSQIWMGGGPGRRLQSVRLTGGALRPFLSDRVVNIAWSRDGMRLAYHTRDPGDPIYVADREGADARQIFINANPGGHNHYPTWSPDGRWIYFVSGYPATQEMDLWRVDSSGGSPERLTQHNNEVGYPTFIDEGTVVYIARDDRGTGPWLWALDVERKVTRRVSVGPATYTSVSANADGSRLIATVANESTSLWSVPILDRPAGDADAIRFPVPTVNAAAPRFGGASLFYWSSGSSGNALLRYQNGESVEIRRDADAVTPEPPAISRDGRVAIALRRSGKLRLHVLSADGAELRPLSDAVDVAGAATWSPDDNWILTGGSDAKGAGLFKVPIDGGVPVRLAAGQALDPVWSSRGDVIVYTGANVGSQAPLLAIRPDGTAVDFPHIEVRREGGGSRARFLPDGSGLVYMQGFTLAQDFWLLDLATKQRRRLTTLSDQAAMWSFDIHPDGKQIVFDRSRDNSHVVIIDLPREEPDP